MRNPTPFASLHDVPFDLVDEYDGDEASFPDGGLCWPNDPLDKVLGYVPVLDDGFLGELGFGPCCSPPPPLPGGSSVEEDGVGSVDADGAIGVLVEESALCGKRKRSSSACEVFDGVPGLAMAVPRPGGGFDTCAAGAAAAMEDGFPAEEALALPLPARAPSCSSTLTTTSATSSCPSGLSSASIFSCSSHSPPPTTSSCKTESPSTERASVLHPWTVPRNRRSRPAATVHKRPWSLASPLSLALMPAATHDSHGDNNNGDDDDDDKDHDFSYSNNSCGSGKGNVLRRSAGRQRSGQVQRTCTHCQSSETPQWRLGPDGPGTLCNACGIRYKMGKLYPEYRPSTSPSFSSDEHSNRHRKVVKLREKKQKVMAATGLPPVPVTPNTGEVLPLCKYN